MKIGELPQKLVFFLKEVRLEIKKVNWPTRQETIKYTLMVIGACFFVAVFLGGLDYLLTIILNKFVVR
jgi:preprotein translocase subunit SecE